MNLIVHLRRWLTIGILLFWFASAFGQDSANQDYSSQLPRIPPVEPDRALSTFEISPGLKLELVAAEPLVVDPVAIDFDEMGRAYVVEMRGYSLQCDQLLSRIRLLTDADHDGRFDSATVFVDKLRCPTAVCCVAGGILVGDAPELTFFKDTDGDGVADTRQVVFSEFGAENIQQRLNNLQWGLDNRIYGASGGNGGIVRRVATQPILARAASMKLSPSPQPVNEQGRDFAFDPATLRMWPTTGAHNSA